jgi:hypothetical protein
MSRRITKIASQAETADVVSALSEAAGSSSSSAPIYATRGASAALLAKEILPNPPSVATSSSGLGFRSFSPVASNSIPPASSSLFLTENDLPPSNQLDVSQIVPETMLPSQPGAMILPAVTLPLNTKQVSTAYSLLCTLRLFCCENPGVLDTTSALVQLPPVGDAQSPYQVPPPPPVWPVPQLPLRGVSLTGNLQGEQEDYAQNVYVYHLVNAATALASALRLDVGEGHTAIRDISVGFGVDHQRLNVVCTEAPGVVVYTDPAMEDEADMDEVLDVNYGAGTLTENERIHYGDLKDRYRQRRDRTRQLVAQLSTLNTRQTLNPTEVRLLGRTLTKEDIRKCSKFETLATTICGQQDAIETLRRCYDEQVASSSAQLAHLTRSHEAKMAQELGQAKVHVEVANDRVKASEAHAQLRLQEQEQRSALLISELRKALKAITDQDVANTRASAEMEVLLRKELLEAKQRLAQLEPA